MNKLFFIVTLLAFTFCTAAPLPYSFDQEVLSHLEENGQTVNVFVHISAVKTTKDGKRVAKISKVTMAKSQKPAKNVIQAKLRRVNNLLQLEIQMLKGTPDRFIMPKCFVINDRISKLLGASGQVVMSGGSTMVKQTSKSGILNFEIQ